MIHVSVQPSDSFSLPDEGHPAAVEDLSAGGVYLCTDLPLRKGRHLWFDLQEVDGTLTAQILRVDSPKSAAGKQRFGYGCRFIELTAQQESQLRGYVFREELRRRKR